MWKFDIIKIIKSRIYNCIIIIVLLLLFSDRSFRNVCILGVASEETEKIQGFRYHFNVPIFKHCAQAFVCYLFIFSPFIHCRCVLDVSLGVLCLLVSHLVSY